MAELENIIFYALLILLLPTVFVAALVMCFICWGTFFILLKDRGIIKQVPKIFRVEDEEE